MDLTKKLMILDDTLQPLFALMSEALEAGVRYYTETEPHDLSEAGFARAMLTAVQTYHAEHRADFIGTDHLKEITDWIECEADRYTDHTRVNVVLGLLDSLSDFFGDSDAVTRATEHDREDVAAHLSSHAQRLYREWQPKATAEVLARVSDAKRYLKAHHAFTGLRYERLTALLRAAGAL